MRKAALCLVLARARSGWGSSISRYRSLVRFDDWHVHFRSRADSHLNLSTTGTCAAPASQLCTSELSHPLVVLWARTPLAGFAARTRDWHNPVCICTRVLTRSDSAHSSQSLALCFTVAKSTSRAQSTSSRLAFLQTAGSNGQTVAHTSDAISALPLTAAATCAALRIGEMACHIYRSSCTCFRLRRTLLYGRKLNVVPLKRV